MRVFIALNKFMNLISEVRPQVYFDVSQNARVCFWIYLKWVQGSHSNMTTAIPLLLLVDEDEAFEAYLTFL